MDPSVKLDRESRLMFRVPQGMSISRMRVEIEFDGGEGFLEFCCQSGGGVGKRASGKTVRRMTFD